jgi:predicted ester cyclase
MMNASGTLAVRALKVIETGSLAEIDELLDEHYIQHNDLGPGREPVKAMMVQLRAGLSNISVHIHDLICEADRVVARIEIEGQHTGELFGAPATGRTIRIKAIDIWRVENGKLKEHWDSVDRLGMLRQLGLLGPERS